MKAGTLIAFEGIDGSGKSTQLERLAKRLRSRGVVVETTCEPTGGVFGRRIRAMARSGDRPPPGEELRWFIEDRREHVKSCIAPALSRGAVVLTDRYFLSTVAYQGARGHDPVALLVESEAEFPIPDLVLLFEIEPEAGLARVKNRLDHLEPAFEEHGYLSQVAAVFASIDRPYLERIDARGTSAEVDARVEAAVERRLGA